MTGRVAIVCGAGIVSGKEVMALELGEGLRDRGLHVEFVASSWGTGEFAHRLRQTGFAVHMMRLGFISATLTLSAIRMTLHQLLYFPGLLLQYISFLRSWRPSRVIHTNWHHTLLLLPLLSRRRDIYWVHEIVPNNLQVRMAFRAVSKRVGCFIAVSQATAAGLRQIGVPDRKIRVIHNGIKDPAEGEGLVPKLSASRVGIVGQVGPWKGHEDLLNAFAIVVEAHPAAELHIFGAGSSEYESHLRERAAELGVDSRIAWHGFVSDRADIFRRIDVCVVPSRTNDPLPTSAIEASLFCLPVIASRGGGLPEIIEDGATGFLFEGGDFKQLARHILTIFNDSRLAEKLGRKARSDALTKFSRDRFIDEFSSLIAA
ncbi:MAG: hypothetical protein QOI04_1136 [Verrucomicrobiota bacterium]|jgi:glycosyltransferase involved in cell wall biosynthesis